MQTINTELLRHIANKPQPDDRVWNFRCLDGCLIGENRDLYENGKIPFSVIRLLFVPTTTQAYFDEFRFGGISRLSGDATREEVCANIIKFCDMCEAGQIPDMVASTS